LPAWLFIRRRPEDLGLLPDGDAPESGIDGVGAARTPGSARAAQEVSWTLAEAKRTRAFWLIVVAVTAVVFAQTAVNLHAVASFQDRGVANASAGVFVFIFAGTAALSAYAWGALMDRIQVRWGTLLATLFMAGAMVSIIFADNLLLALLFAVLYGLGSGGWTVGQTLLFANYFGRGNLGAIRGLALTISGPLSAMGPLLAGYIQTYFGDYRIAFVIFLAALGVVVLALLLAAPPKRPLATPS
jgi:MFS family permease